MNDYDDDARLFARELEVPCPTAGTGLERGPITDADIDGWTAWRDAQQAAPWRQGRA